MQTETFECVIVLPSGERVPNAFYGEDYTDARAQADRYIGDDGEVSAVIFDCEL